MAIDPGSSPLRVEGHLPLGWRSVDEREADRVRSGILDAAVNRAWRETDVPLSEMTPGMRHLLERINDLEKRVARLTTRANEAEQPPLPVRALGLTADSCVINLLPEEFPPAPGALVEVRLTLPLAEKDEVIVLARVIASAAFSFEVGFLSVAQDQADLIVRYLLNRQRLAQSHPIR